MTVYRSATPLRVSSPARPGPTLHLQFAARCVLKALPTPLRPQGPEASFLLRRGFQETLRVDGVVGRRIRSLVTKVEAGCSPSDVARELVALSGHLEEVSELELAQQALGCACDLGGDVPELHLHLGRIHRKRGDFPSARAEYLKVSEAGHYEPRLHRLARLGEALLSRDADAALGKVAREAQRAGDAETVGIAMEERAHLQAAQGRHRSAVRQALSAAARYPDTMDRTRLLHWAADLLQSRGDLAGARRILLSAQDLGREPQRRFTRQRLHILSRALGDELGIRRWRDGGPPALISLMPPRSRRQATDPILPGLDRLLAFL